MTDLTQALRAALEAPKAISDTELRLRRSIPESETLPARAIGYSWGQMDEHARTQALVLAMVEAMDALDKIWDTPCDIDSDAYIMATIAEEALARVREELAQMEGK